MRQCDYAADQKSTYSQSANARAQLLSLSVSSYIRRLIQTFRQIDQKDEDCLHRIHSTHIQTQHTSYRGATYRSHKFNTNLPNNFYSPRRASQRNPSLTQSHNSTYPTVSPPSKPPHPPQPLTTTPKAQPPTPPLHLAPLIRTPLLPLRQLPQRRLRRLPRRTLRHRSHRAGLGRRPVPRPSPFRPDGHGGARGAGLAARAVGGYGSLGAAGTGSHVGDVDACAVGRW